MTHHPRYLLYCQFTPCRILEVILFTTQNTTAFPLHWPFPLPLSEAIYTFASILNLPQASQYWFSAQKSFSESPGLKRRLCQIGVRLYTYSLSPFRAKLITKFASLDMMMMRWPLKLEFINSSRISCRLSSTLNWTSTFPMNGKGLDPVRFVSLFGLHSISISGSKFQ